MRIMLCFFILFCTILWAQSEVTVTVIGRGETEAQAKADALRLAIEQGAGVRIFSETQVKDFVALKDVLISESFGWVTGYDVIYSIRKGIEYEVKITARVTKDISSAWAKIKILIQSQGNPKVMFCLKETLDGQEIIPSNGETALVNEFQKLGFVVIDRQTAAAARELQKNIAQMEQNLDSVIAISSKCDADLVVAGTLECNFSKTAPAYDTTYLLHSYNYNVKIINVDNALIDGAVTETYITKKDSRYYDQQSGGKAGFAQIVEKKYIEKLMSALIRSWASKGGETEYTVIVSNLKGKKERQIIVNILKEQTDLISSVQVGHFRNGRLELRVKAKMTAEDLVEKLEALEEINLELVEFKRNVIELKYCPE